jgi:rare lipoprotein A (peptidoglycan hydrolase)
VPPPAPPPAPAPRVVAAAGAPEGEVTGLATWYGGADGYGPEDIMTDGSYFNPNDPTIVAANLWPLGTWLRVCYLDRCIEVQVRDRGAFSHALDLSYAAFSQLAPPSSGVITVTISRVG